ncbi:hypothetical protein N4562_06245 [Ligilactobacillus agilis]|uniref:Uncharacterized protein n=1 Tax=Ligilactobacillus agilis TaxID=1601 RepID=A0A9Q9J302_9LACO|nr:hypothetical protein [Ligilactobacillus agilis]UXC62699.1 hypothetical protein N4562_06245 [Ligilactobacillus agilis]UXC64700.1 hypothetical protein N4597_06245 [Ligilactobacillus agilis]
MDDKIIVYIKDVEYADNAEDSKMHITLNIDILIKPEFANMNLVKKLAREVNATKL